MPSVRHMPVLSKRSCQLVADTNEPVRNLFTSTCYRTDFGLANIMDFGLKSAGEKNLKSLEKQGVFDKVRDKNVVAFSRYDVNKIICTVCNNTELFHDTEYARNTEENS